MRLQNQADEINQILKTGFSPTYLQVVDESHQHHTHSKAETHFKVILVSESFTGVSRIKRHQAVYQALNEVMRQIHALALHLYTPVEWEKAQEAQLTSPACRGGFDEH